VSDFIMGSRKLAAAISAIQDLTDEDHELLKTWFRPGTRQQLRANGITDADIGPLRANDYPESDEDLEPLLKRRAPKPTLIRAVHAMRALSDQEMLGIDSWFGFASRKTLEELGLAGADLGPWRVVLDELESDDLRYPEALAANARAEELAATD